MLTLYYSPGACSLAAHIVLEEAGATFEAKRVTILEGEHRTPEYLRLNPHGRVPTLTDGDFVLTESLAILSYLGHRFTDSGLLDLGNLEHLGRTHELLSFFSSSVHIAFAQVFRAARFADSESAQAEIATSGRATVERYFTELEELAKGGDWIVDGRYSIADPYLLVFYRWGSRIGFDMARYPGWTRHKDEMMARPAVRRAATREEIEFP